MDEAIFLTDFVLVLKKRIKPCLDFFAHFDIKQLRNLLGCILGTPQ